MSKVIKCKLDVDSLDNAIRELEAYRDEIRTKLGILVNTLYQQGIQVASARLGSTLGDADNAEIIGLGVNGGGDIMSATISLVGTEALFVEFGAGIAYNTGAQHPQAAQFGYGIGTYPSKHPPNKAMRGYWFYRENGEKVTSIGTQASMPIYGAAETVRNNAIKTALEIFRS